MMTAREIMNVSKIIPVIELNSVDDALKLGEALLKGGVGIFEVTLRTASALDIIESLARTFPEAKTGAGTVLTTESFKMVEDRGASFAISPGLTRSLAEYKSAIPLIPGAVTASEVMQGLEYGFDAFKLFPAEAAGGVEILKALYKPFSSVVFCPTAGVNASNVNDYLALDNVLCVGGSWILPSHLIKEQKFDEITKLTKQALEAIK
jgi:2-dehydro-3-deoxyphosphogluconate aldolase/(4S)-4-hydroxy-2-oxoglutarate aldolase